MAENTIYWTYAGSRQEMKDERLCKEILERMRGDGHKRIVLTGKSGIGKTRLAGKIGKYVTVSWGDNKLGKPKYCVCYVTLWLHLNNKFDDELSLYEYIAFQVGAYDRDEDGKQVDDLVKALKEMITAELSYRKRTVVRILKDLEEGTVAQRKRKDFPEEENRNTCSAEMPYILLILDDEGNNTSEDKVMKELGLSSFLEEQAPLNIIITRREGYENTTMSDEEPNPLATYLLQATKSEGEIESHTRGDPQVTKSDEKTESHTTDGSQALRDTLDMSNLQDLFESLINGMTRSLLESLQRAWKIDKPLTYIVAQKCIGLPAAVVVLAKSLHCITHQDRTMTPQDRTKCLSPKQEKVLKNSLSFCRPVHAVSGSNPILQLAYQLLETDDTLKNAIVDCFWHSLDFFKHCGCVHYGELITQWILEGYFDPVRSVKEAYDDGHVILVELIKRGILNIQEGDMVVPEMAMDNLIDLRHHGLFGRSRLRFSRVYGGEKKKGLGKITQIDDMIKTVQKLKQENIFTVIASGNRLRRETPKVFFEQQQMKDIEVLCFFNPTLDPLIPYLATLQKLRVLVIRDCDLLSDIEELKCLRGLNVFEVSGASSVETIPDDFFVSMSELQSLNLSGLRIKHSPSSISQLENLCSLILRDCHVLEDLPDVQTLSKLEVFDVRGARRLQSCFGIRFDTRRNQTFSHLQQLQLLDFSESKITRLPMFHTAAAAHKIHSLKRLSLQNCSNLLKLPSLKPLSGLQILDLSGTASLVDIAAVCFEQKEELKILNLSGTKFTKLPSTISELPNLSQLLLRDSSNLEAIPNVERLKSLEVFDVSGCTKLQKIEGSFKNMSYLREVNLSGTKIEALPEFSSNISGVSILSQLLLRDISSLEAIPNIEGLTSLEVFDVSGCTKLHRIEGSFKDMSYLREVNLSGTRIETLPELPEENGILCSKLVILANSRRCMHDTWGQVKEAITAGMSMRIISSDTVNEIQEFSAKEFGIVRKKQLSEPWGFDCLETKSASWEQLNKGHIYRNVYMNTIPFVDTTKSCREILKIQGSNGVDQDKETLAKAEFVVFVDNTAASISSIYNDLKSMKGCWLEMCGDIDILDKRLGNLETLSITNLRRLTSICSSSFRNLKQLSLDCCPSIITLFPASASHTSLEVLKIKFCDKLEKVFEEDIELLNLHTLCLFELPALTAIGAKLPNLEKYKKDKCPKLKSSQEYLKGENGSNEIVHDSDYENVEHSEII